MKLIALALLCYLPGYAVAAGPDYSESITLAAEHGANPAGWVAPAGSIFTISGNPATDAQYGIKYDSGKIIVRTDTKSAYYKTHYVGEAGYTINGSPSTDAAWVTTGRSVTEFMTDNGATGANAVKLLERGLGMNTAGTHDMIVEYAVTPSNDTIMRPTKNPDMAAYSTNPADYGDSANFVQPSGMSAATYANFRNYYNNWKVSALDGKTFPWTQLGYTFFWDNGYNLADIQGMSEFILLGGTGVDIYGLYSAQSYIYTRNDGTDFSAAATAQYGNGFASFDVTGACDTIYAGHPFQKNIRTLVSNPNRIIVESTAAVSGGAGILVWSLNYDVANNGSITGATAQKLGLANSSNVALLFKGDVSTSSGTPVTSGINKFTNSGIISSPGTAVQALAGDTVIVNNTGGVISGGAMAVQTGSGDDSVTLHGGTVTGDIDLGGGANTFTLDGATRLNFTVARNTADTAHIRNAVSVTIADDAATVAPVVGGADNIRDNDSFLIVDAGTLAATSSKISVLNDATHPMLSFSPVKVGDQLYVAASRDNHYYRNLSGNPSLGAALDSLANSSSGDIAAVIGALDSTGNPADARQLEPQNAVDALAASSQLQARFTDNIMSHIVSVSSGPAAWGQVFDSYLSQDARGSGAGYDADIWGVTGGYDFKSGGDSLFGLGLGYASNKIRAISNGGRTDVESFQGSVYGLNRWDEYYLSGIFQLGFNKYTGSRNVVFGSINRMPSSNYKGGQYSAYAEGGRMDGLGRFSFTTLASLQYSYMRNGSYTETGGDSIALSVAAKKYATLESGLGFRLAYEQGGRKQVVVPDLHARWLYSLVRGDQQIDSELAAGGGSFETGGYDATRSSLRAGTKWDVNIRENLVFSASYDIEARKGYRGHSGYANLRLRF